MWDICELFLTSVPLLLSGYRKVTALKKVLIDPVTPFRREPHGG